MSEHDHPECWKFPEGSRRRAICDGSANMPLDKMNEYRAGWGIGPFDDPENTVAARPARVATVVREAVTVRKDTLAVEMLGPGRELLKIYAEAGVPACQACYDLARRMNEMGPAECRDKIDELIVDILPRAKAWVADNMPWTHKLLPGVIEDIGIRHKVRQDILLAIQRAEALSVIQPAKTAAATPTVTVSVKKKDRPNLTVRPVVRAEVQPRSTAGRAPFSYRPGTVPEFVTTARLMEDAKRLASMLPADTSLIVGVARSGLCVATMVAMILHRPLAIMRQSKQDVIDGGNGWRLTGNTSAGGPVVVIDDTCMTGNSFKQVMPIVRRTHPKAIAAAVYLNPNARVQPDLYVRHLPSPHVLEWNICNSVYVPAIAFDFDGILCRDCRMEQDDDGEQYLDFLANAKPLYMVRKVTIPLIVTARIEKYRPQTLAWLAKHDMNVSRLVMGPWSTKAERSMNDIAAYKAKYFRAFMAERHKIRPPMFMESDPAQAAKIAKLSGGLVICPAAGKVFG